MVSGYDDLFSRAVKCLVSNKIPFVVVGGAIVPYYGNLRATQDIDLMLLVEAGSENLESLVECFNENDISISSEDMTECITENIPVSGFDTKTWVYRLDIKRVNTPFDRITFENRRYVMLENMEVPISSVESLIAIKVSDGFRSDQDMEDISSIIDSMNIKDLDLNLLQQALQLLNAKEQLLDYLDQLGTENCRQLAELLRE